MSAATYCLEDPCARSVARQTSPLHEYAHLRDESAMFVTGYRRIAEHEFRLCASWPASPGELAYEPRVLVQTVRQCGLIVAHAEYGVPLTHQTLLHNMNFTMRPALHDFRDAPSSLDIRTVVSDTRRPGRATDMLRMDFQILRAGAVVAGADLEFAWISPRAYRRLRGAQLDVVWGDWPLPAPADPGLVGRSTDGDVVLAADGAPNRWLLRNDIRDRMLFDHAVDHVPGAVLLEAADQAARALLAPRHFVPSGLTSNFSQYVEFDSPCSIRAEPLPDPGHGQVTVLISGTQDGESVFTVELTGTTC
ncbi:ScbA/BarX family gamma-butyrolactone biosynthesis protein [Streptomyces xanthochromogenes]|uniref:ScbA/BarX family gamma-butyrolactone biosynthesis protein n=1 Tax=Streptomyces xanthochromogenes TaxID=67384 RepID=UPI0037B8D16E